jgi:hypothetical protein
MHKLVKTLMELLNLAQQRQRQTLAELAAINYRGDRATSEHRIVPLWKGVA